VTIDFFRERSEEESHFDRSDDVEQRAENVAQAPPEQTEEDEGFHPWLAKHVARSESDSKTFELMMRKAREKLTSAEIAEIAGISANAYDKRTQALREKYAPLRKRYLSRRNALLLALKIFAVGAVVIGIGFAIWKYLAHDDIRRDPDEHRRGRTPPAPSASATPAPTFDQALPPPPQLPPPNVPDKPPTR
jgi:hypothetical protein